TWFNLSFRLLRLLGEPTISIRYEDVVRDPQAVLRRLCAFMGMELSEEDLSFIHDGEANLSFGHIVARNRMRLVNGPVRIRLDEQWRSGLEPRDQRLVTAITCPLLRLDGYVRRA